MSIDEASSVYRRLPDGLTEGDFELLRKKGLKVTILKTMWYPELLDLMERSARDFFEEHEVNSSAVKTLGVPGALELPLAAKLAAQSSDIVVALGCVIRGETPHFDHVCTTAIEGLLKVSLDEELPMGIGVLTVENKQQAQKRLDKGFEAAQAACCMYLQKRKNA